MSPRDAPAIRLDRVEKRWGEARAVDAISFAARAGSFVVLLGPSGCGKSTTLRLVAGLDTPTAGRIELGGRDVTGLPPAARDISMVFQSYALFPHLTVAENIVFGLKVRGVGASERNARLAETAALLGLEALLARKPSQLSGGQQQRVALGRAIISRAPICLMDEPLSNLDAQLRHEMRREIRALQQSLGITMLYVTHDQAEAMSMADQVILMRAGRIEQDAAPAAMYARPATAFAARFIGTPPMNVLSVAEGRLADVAVAQDGAPLLLGVRPEAIVIGPDGAPSQQGRTTVPAAIVSAEYLGADSIVACRVGEQAIAVRSPGRVDAAAGAAVTLAWSHAEQHFFDAATEARVNIP